MLATRRAPALAASTVRPIRPPTQSDPASRWSQSSQRGAGGQQGAGDREDLGHRALLSLRPVEQDRHGRGDGPERQDQLEVQEAAPERGRPHQRHQVAEVQRRALRELGGGNVDVDGDDDERERECDCQRSAHPAQRDVRDAPRQRAHDHEPEDEQAYAGHDGEERQPAEGQQPGRGRRLSQRRDRELRRRTGVGPYREGERTPHGVAIHRDDAPEDEVPASGQPLDRDDELVRVGLRPRGGPAGDLVSVGVGHRHERELRLHRLAVGEADDGGRAVDCPAGGRRGPQQGGVAPGGAGQGEGQGPRRRRGTDNGSPTPHQVSDLLPPTRPIPARRSAMPATISAMTPSASEPPPLPRSLTALMVGAGVSELSGPFQSTTDPSE